MYSLFRPNTAAISVDADLYIKRFSDAAYCCSQFQERRAFSAGDIETGEHFSRIRMEIARKLDYKPVLDIPERDILTLLGERSPPEQPAKAELRQTKFATAVWEGEGGATNSTKQ